ncbi:LysR family transcriptional regulator [Pseudomonas sp. GD03842]|uniref:LysR family transcriptional regulator n=1 Tax=unclassified Pseudomonas TaxID=196821 RepID=UPI000D376343|nr:MULTISPECIES: LysR family transcriptional regulator [unclassified Pseudomonas]MDH0747515.1 LysR family transcriptional regulator [Pseudomonas sp. GD03842]RAU49451.1 LysR family transcriptional regulator [Pseudomonas sp. RIT 409]RAU55810.1 LysR family transcriptional regulator [Pseudomonas sp. RIT 412]
MSEMEDLAAFAMLIEANSFTVAAQWLDISTSQLSKRISKLENGFGARLLHRTTRSLSLTAAGAVLLPEARALLAQRDKVRDAMACLSERLVGSVRLTVPASLGESVFSALQTGFSPSFPDVHVDLDVNDAYREVGRGGFDLGIRGSMGITQRLTATPLFASQELTCASPDYLAQQGRPQTPEALRLHNCLAGHSQPHRDTWNYQLNQEVSRVNVRGTFSSNHHGLLKQAALAGLGIVRLPSCLVHNELNEGRLQWLLRDYQTPVSSLFLVHGCDGHLPRRVRVMADFLREWFERCSVRLQTL